MTTDKRPGYLDAGRMDDLARMVLELTSEVWALRDRNMILERLLQDRGLLAPGAVDEHRPDDALAAALLTERRALVRRVVGSVLPSDVRTAAALRSD